MDSASRAVDSGERSDGAGVAGTTPAGVEGAAGARRPRTPVSDGWSATLVFQSAAARRKASAASSSGVGEVGASGPEAFAEGEEPGAENDAPEAFGETEEPGAEAAVENGAPGASLDACFERGARGSEARIVNPTVDSGGCAVNESARSAGVGVRGETGSGRPEPREVRRPVVDRDGLDARDKGLPSPWGAGGLVSRFPPSVDRV